jgi:adenylylsulfate kinase-like enzyme
VASAAIQELMTRRDRGRIAQDASLDSMVMRENKTPVLWVSGAPGTGKSTTGWGLFTRIAERGGCVAYVDLDQLGLIGPPPGGGAASHRIKAHNLLRVIATLRRRGVQQVIVSGVVDPSRGIEPYLAGKADMAHIDLTLVRLHCDRDELRRRFLGRGSSADLLEELFDLVNELDRSCIGTLLDTTGHHPDDTVNALMERCLVRPGPVRSLPAVPGDDALLPAPVVVVTGATAVGKSTAAWSALRSLWQRGVSTAYVDLGQLGFVHPGPDPALEAANLAALWRGYLHAGAEALLVVTREPAVALRALPDDPVIVVRLDADAATLTDRVRCRAEGESALLAGDELRGAPLAVQRRVATRAVAEADRLRRSEMDGIVLNTTAQDPSETSAALLDAMRPILGPLVTRT